MKMFNLTPGKEVGRLKGLVEEAIINGDIKNTYSDAISFLDRIKHEKWFFHILLFLINIVKRDKNIYISILCIECRNWNNLY